MSRQHIALRATEQPLFLI